MALAFTMQVEQVSEALLEVPTGINDGIDRCEVKVVSDGDSQCELPDAAEFGEKHLGVVLPGVGKLVGWKSVRFHLHSRICAGLRAVHTSLTSLASVKQKACHWFGGSFHEGDSATSYDIYCLMLYP
jgi:hypothetical protein